MKATSAPTFALLTALAISAGTATATSTTPVDQAGNVGQRNAIAIGADGFPVISHILGQPGTTGASLRVTKCGSADCVTGNLSLNVATGGVAANLSLVIPPDGRPVLAYLQDVGGDLVARVTRCGNAQCSIGNTTETLPGTPLGEPAAMPFSVVPTAGRIALGADDLPIIAFAQPGSVRIVKCADAGCSSTASTVAPLPEVSTAKVAVGPDGMPVIAALNPHLQVAKCSSAACTLPPAFREIAREGEYEFGDTGDYGLAVGLDNRPVFSLKGSDFLRLFRCDAPACDGQVRFTTLWGASRAALAHGDNGLPIIALTSFDATYVLRCGDPLCASDSRLSLIDDRGLDISMAIGADGNPVIAYADAVNQDLYVARCSSASCQNESSRAAIAQAGVPLAFVTAFERGRVVAFDTDWGIVVTEIPVGDGPTGVAFSRDGKKGYVTNLTSGTVSFIDVKTRTVEKTVALGANAQPREIAVAPDHTRLYVAKGGTNEVAVIDRASGTVLALVPVGQQPFGLAITADGSVVITANTSGHSASFVATANNALLGTVPVGQQPYGVATSPDGALAYVANSASDSVSVLATPTRTVVASIPVGAGAFGIAVRSDGSRLYVSDDRYRVSIVDAATGSVITSIPVGSHPRGVALSPDDWFLYVANRDSNTMTRIATDAMEVNDTWPSPGEPASLGAFVSPPLIDAAEAVEYVHQDFGHYFVTSLPAEIQALDAAAFAGWARTGETFDVFSLESGHADVCRFFTTAFPPKSSHFYTPLANECTNVKNSPDWTYEGVVFRMFVSFGGLVGICPAGMTPLYRLYNNGMGGAPNHRYTTKTSIRDQTVAAGFLSEGPIGCVPK